MPRKKFNDSDIREAFWRRVIKTPYCWNWDGALDQDGYGQFTCSKNDHRVRHESHLAWAVAVYIGFVLALEFWILTQ